MYMRNNIKVEQLRVDYSCLNRLKKKRFENNNKVEILEKEVESKKSKVLEQQENKEIEKVEPIYTEEIKEGYEEQTEEERNEVENADKEEVEENQKTLEASMEELEYIDTEDIKSDIEYKEYTD